MNTFAATFKDLLAWKKAYQLTLTIYKYTRNFPNDETFGLKSQIRRAAVSVISNIAEGFKRQSKKDRIRFYNLAETSLEELKCQSMLSQDLCYISQEQYQTLRQMEDESGKLLSSWIKSQKARS